jgi:hypothetical protein
MFENQKKAGFRGDYRQFKRQLKERRSTLVASLEPEMPAAITERQATYLSQVSEEHGVLCMSARRDSILMWGHYCDKHRGIVIGLDSSWELLQGVKGLRPVEYVRERVVLDSSCAPGGLKERTSTEQLIFSKNDEWKYEDELRQLFTLRGLPQRPLDNGTTGYFLPIPPAVLTSVSLGMRCPAELERKVRSALRNPGLSHVKLDRAVLHQSEFVLRFE